MQSVAIYLMLFDSRGWLAGSWCALWHWKTRGCTYWEASGHV